MHETPLKCTSNRKEAIEEKLGGSAGLEFHYVTNKVSLSLFQTLALAVTLRSVGYNDNSI